MRGLIRLSALLALAFVVLACGEGRQKPIQLPVNEHWTSPATPAPLEASSCADEAHDGMELD